MGSPGVSDEGDGPDKRRRRRQTSCRVFQPARGAPGTAPCPPGLARSAGQAAGGAGLRAALSLPGAPGSLPRRRRGCPVPVPACRLQETTGNPAKVAAEEVQGEPKAAGRRAATWDGRAAGTGRRRGRASSPEGVPAETLPLSPGRRRAPAGRASAQQSRRQAMPAGGSIAAVPARRGGRRPGCPQPGRARRQPRSALLRSAQRCPAPRRPRIRPAAAAAAVAAALPARSEAETPGGGGGIVLEAQGVRSEVRLIDRGAATRRSPAAGSGDGTARPAGAAPAPPPPRSGQPRPAAPAPRRAPLRDGPAGGDGSWRNAGEAKRNAPRPAREPPGAPGSRGSVPRAAPSRLRIHMETTRGRRG